MSSDANLASPVIAQLYGSGVLDFLITPKARGANRVDATAPPALIAYLDNHPRFTRGNGHHMHTDVGERRRDYRSDSGAFGKGSLQIVTGWQGKTLHVYADIDLFNANGTPASKLGHAGEVLYGLLGLFRKKGTQR